MKLASGIRPQSMVAFSLFSPHVHIIDIRRSLSLELPYPAHFNSFGHSYWMSKLIVSFRLWNDWIKQESNQYRFQLKPGTALSKYHETSNSRSVALQLIKYTGY